MLARYDHERIAVPGMEPVGPLTDHAATIPEGYDPTTGLKGFPKQLWTPEGAPRSRPDDATMAEEFTFAGQPPLRRDDLDLWYGRLMDVATTGQVRVTGGATVPVGDIDPIGHATEPSRTRVGPGEAPQPSGSFYGQLHGQGHILLSAAAGTPLGVMSDTAIRDPVFFRWHRHVDELGFAWQERQPAHALADVAAPVAMRRAATHASGRPAESPDIVLLRDLPPKLDDAELAAHVTALIGGDHVDEDFADTAPGTAELRTEMRTRLLDIAELASPPVVQIHYLDQEEFAYAVRLRNTAGVDHEVTVRLFLVADELFEQRRMWIELDKFSHTVTGERSVAVRHARLSAVIRKPALKPPGPTSHSDPDFGPHDEVTYCDCGWPYNLLLPRGTGAGMPFWMAAIVTDGAQDRVQDSACGSMSFCGAKDRYPDARPMGYPFDRPFPGSVAAALDSLPSIAARSFSIRWINP